MGQMVEPGILGRLPVGLFVTVPAEVGDRVVVDVLLQLAGVVIDGLVMQRLGFGQRQLGARIFGDDPMHGVFAVAIVLDQADVAQVIQYGGFSAGHLAGDILGKRIGLGSEDGQIEDGPPGLVGAQCGEADFDDFGQRVRGVVVARVDRQAVSGLGHGLEGCSGAVGVAIGGFAAQVFADQDQRQGQSIDSADQIVCSVGIEGDGLRGNLGQQGQAGGGVEFRYQFRVAKHGGDILAAGGDDENAIRHKVHEFLAALFSQTSSSTTRIRRLPMTFLIVDFQSSMLARLALRSSGTCRAVAQRRSCSPSSGWRPRSAQSTPSKCASSCSRSASKACATVVLPTPGRNNRLWLLPWTARSQTWRTSSSRPMMAWSRSNSGVRKGGSWSGAGGFSGTAVTSLAGDPDAQ
jgi:hypothetical protein